MKSGPFIFFCLVAALWIGCQNHSGKERNGDTLPDTSSAVDSETRSGMDTECSDTDTVEGEFTADPVVITDRNWPENHGEADLCLWKDDRLAAFSFTIDDNTAPEHEWWIARGNEYGFRFTWFVVSGSIGTAWGGSWGDFIELFSLGHDVQSHTVTHLSGELDITAEYADSKAAIEEGVPGAKVLTLAYPGGEGSELNDVEVASEYYIGARGTYGANNPADNIQYMLTNSISGSFNLSELENTYSSLPALLNSESGHYRGWQCMHFHQVAADEASILEGFDYLGNNEDDFWVGLYREIILYARERDTAKLEVVSASENRIVLRLRDQMNDALFDLPLTIKVRVDNEWDNIVVEQCGEAIEYQTQWHNGNQYLLLPVVPDRGLVTVHP
ncbi:MAG: polysaccharide deacetylase family protein [Myxococcota bacterium]|nr:polysaccharide deacetylase family protein [Myxococcota bacterium]